MLYFVYRFGSVLLEYQAEAKEIIEEAGEDVFWSEQTSIIYDSDGNIITTLSAEKDSYYLTIDEIPEYVQQAFIVTEDRDFYDHNGVDFEAVLRAMWALIVNEGEITQGGSTITQQLCKLVYLSNDVTYERKLREMFLAFQLEKTYTKDEILEFYINNVYFANGYYGIEAAAQGYFSKSADELTLSEIAFLCAIPNSPTKYDPLTNYDNTMERRDRVLEQMLVEGVIDQDTYLEALDEEITLDPAETVTYNYVETYVKYCATQELMELAGFDFQYDFDSDEEREAYDEEYAELYDECSAKLYTGGYKIYTSIDMTAQAELQAVVDEQLADYDEVDDEGVYTFQAAATCIDNETGQVIAIVGGRTQDFSGYTLNRAYQSYRQPGSTIKPLLVYTPALMMGYTPDSIINDSKTDESPSNYNDTYYGNVTLRFAVYESLNTCAWKLYVELGAGDLLDYLTDMQFSQIVDDDYDNSTMAIGGMTEGTSTVEMAAAYSTLENDGIYRKPSCIVKIISSDNSVYITDVNDESIIYTEDASRVMTNILEDVLTLGTGTSYNIDNAICAAKTGTTNDNYDKWFVGYSTYYTTAVWVGYDYPETITNTTLAGKIWQEFMYYMHDGLELVEFEEAASLSSESETTTSSEEETETEEETTTEETTTNINDFSTDYETVTDTDESSETDTTEENIEDSSGTENSTESDTTTETADTTE